MASKERENMTKTILVALAAACVAAGCTGPSARVKSGDEGDLVDVRKGGTETYKELIRKGVAELLAEHRITLGNSAEKVLVAFVGVDNKSSEELGEFRASMNNEITTALVNSRLYSMISMKAVDAARRESNVRLVEDLATPRNRQAFLAALNKDGAPPQYLLFGE